MKRITRRRLLIGIFLILLPGLLSWARWRPAQRYEPTPKAAHEFRVVSWNVGYFASIKDKNLRDTDMPQIGKLLTDLDADVIILQELREAQQASKIANLLGEDWTATTVGTGHGKQVLAVLTDRPILETEELDCGSRNALGVSLEGNDGEKVYLLGVHHPHPGWSVDENISSIRCAMTHLAERPETKKITAGDFNYHFTPHGDDELYREISQTFADSTTTLGSTYYARTRIDHFFHTPKTLTATNASGMIDLPLRFAKVPGFRDHRPIVVTYRDLPFSEEE